MLVGETHNVDVPFVGLIPQGLNHGSQIVITGHVPHWFVERFDINLVLGHNQNHDHVRQADIGLHFNPRFDEDHIVLNSRRDGFWEQEVSYRNVLNPFRTSFVLDSRKFDAD